MAQNLLARCCCVWVGLRLALVVGQMDAPVWCADKPQAKVKSSSPVTDPAAETTKGTPSPPFAGTKTGQEWNSNCVKMKFVWCEPGTFMMGSPKGEPERSEDEDQVSVTLSHGFWLGKFEVTQEQWKAVMKTEPWDGMIRVRIASDSPACWLSWDQAHLFCQEFTRQERESGALPDDWEYILPTEAQWEYACRAGTTTKYSFGDDDARLFDYAWYGEQQRQPQQMNARAVGQKKANPWGFYDMHGNVVEWCRDWYRPEYPGGTDPFVATEFNNRVTLRGGEWRLERRWSRSACRQNLLPSGTAATIGLRVSLQATASDGASGGPKIKLAVVSFENRGQNLAYERIGPALSSLVAGRLSQLAALDVLERQSAQDLTDEASLARTGQAKDGFADKQKAFADYVLSGTCEASVKLVKVTARLSKPGFPQPVGEWTVQGSIDDLFRLEAEISRKVSDSLKVSDKVQPPPVAKTGESPVVAIMPFINHSPTSRLDDMQLGFAELLQAGLGEVPGIRLVERKQIEKIIAEQKLTIGGLVDPQTAIQIARLVGAQRLLTGSFLEINDQMSLQVRMINTRTGAVVSSARVTGTSDKFDELTDELTRRIIQQLEVPLPEPSSEVTGPTRFGRSLEAALHSAEAERFKREGKLPQAAQAMQQVLLLEPHSVMAHINLIRVLTEMRNQEEIVKVGEHGLLYPEEYARCMQKYNLILPLAPAYAQTRRYEALDQLFEKYADDCGGYRYILAQSVADARIKQKRFPDASRLMEAEAEKDVAAYGIMGSGALKTLFRFYVEHSTSVVGISIKDHQISAQKAIDLYLRVLDAAKDGKPEELTAWSKVLIPAAVNLLTISDDNKRVAFLTPALKAEYQKRELDVFSRSPGTGLEQTYDLGVFQENAGAWAEAIQAYQRFVDQSLDVSTDYIQPLFGNNGYGLFDWIDKRIEAQYRVAHLQAAQLNQQDAARKSFERLVTNFGLAHFAASDALVEMHQLKLTPEIPRRSALVWGGSTSNLVGWKKMLAAESLRMHAVRKDRLTLPDIAPYDVVIVNKSNDFPLVPSEIFALRTYVACGGSILIVVSPVWKPAAPILLNGLLTVFGMQADLDEIPVAKSTEIRPHPITDGIRNFTAFHAVNLRAPDKTSLIKAQGKTILAAQDYRLGRIAVASVGAWYTPEILLVPEITGSERKSVPQNPIPESMIQYRGNDPEPPLLRQTLRWLAEEGRQDRTFTDWHATWRSALQAAQETYACLLPEKSRLRDWNDLPPQFDRLVADAPTRELKEDALWTAGECMLLSGYFLHFNPADWVYIPGKGPPPNEEALMQATQSEVIVPRKPLQNRDSGRRYYDFSLRSEPKFHMSLVKDYSDSPLSPYALWRSAANRTRQTANRTRSKTEGDPGELSRQVMQAKSDGGIYPYAWYQLERGNAAFRDDDYETALPIFEDIAETMPLSAEKEVALINAVKCQIMLRKDNDALRSISQLEALPDIHFQGMFSNFVAASGRETRILHIGLANTHHFTGEFKKAIENLDQNQEFQKWYAERKKPQPKKQ